MRRTTAHWAVIGLVLLLAGCGSAARHRAAVERDLAPRPSGAAPVGRPAAAEAQLPAPGSGPCRGARLDAESFVSGRVGFVVGQTERRPCRLRLLRTLDGGVSFTGRGRPPARSIAFASPRVGFAFGSRLYRTTDAGASWRAVPGISGVVAFAVRRELAVAVLARCHDQRCRFSLVLSRDGGRSWARRPLPDAPSGPRTGDVLLTSAGQGFVRAGSRIWDLALPGGRAARSLALPGPCRYPDGGYIDDALGGTGAHDLWLLCAGDLSAGNQDKLLYRSADGGRSWKRLDGRFRVQTRSGTLRSPITLGGYFAGFAAPSGQDAYLAEQRGTLFQTSDGGHHWRVAPLAASPYLDPFDTGPVAVDFADPRHGWMITFLGAVYRTVDGGRSWQVTNVA